MLGYHIYFLVYLSSPPNTDSSNFTALLLHGKTCILPQSPLCVAGWGHLTSMGKIIQDREKHDFLIDILSNIFSALNMLLPSACLWWPQGWPIIREICSDISSQCMYSVSPVRFQACSVIWALTIIKLPMSTHSQVWTCMSCVMHYSGWIPGAFFKWKLCSALQSDPKCWLSKEVDNFAVVAQVWLVFPLYICSQRCFLPMMKGKILVSEKQFWCQAFPCGRVVLLHSQVPNSLREACGTTVNDVWAQAEPLGGMAPPALLGGGTPTHFVISPLFSGLCALIFRSVIASSISWMLTKEASAHADLTRRSLQEGWTKTLLKILSHSPNYSVILLW